MLDSLIAQLCPACGAFVMSEGCACEHSWDRPADYDSGDELDQHNMSVEQSVESATPPTTPHRSWSRLMQDVDDTVYGKIDLEHTATCHHRRRTRLEDSTS